MIHGSHMKSYSISSSYSATVLLRSTGMITTRNLIVCLLRGCASAHADAPTNVRLYRGEHSAMGTTWMIPLYAGNSASGQAALGTAWLVGGSRIA
jgi:hypothetical protein